jgi:hypothetical protein
MCEKTLTCRTLLLRRTVLVHRSDLCRNFLLEWLDINTGIDITSCCPFFRPDVGTVLTVCHLFLFLILLMHIWKMLSVVIKNDWDIAWAKNDQCTLIVHLIYSCKWNKIEMHHAACSVRWYLRLSNHQLKA